MHLIPALPMIRILSEVSTNILNEGRKECCENPKLDKKYTQERET